MGEKQEYARPPGGLRGLLTDPPLRDRITWREGIYPDLLVTDDRGLMARTFDTLYFVGGLVGFLIALFNSTTEDGGLAIALISVAALILGGACFVGYRRLPLAAFSGMLTLGTLMITAAAAFAAPGSEALYGFYYVWVVFIGFLFFSRAAATAQALFAALAYAAVLVLEDTPFTANLLISAAATFGTAGVLMGLVRAQMERMAVELTSQAHTDPVTTLTNRRGFDERLRAEVDRALRARRPLSLVICDLDRFKAVNDALGHSEGDIALRRAASAVLEATRGSDLVARLGGEEIAVLLPESGGAAAFAVAERIRNSIRVEFDGFPVPLTSSCGVATLEPDGSGDELLRAADSALYSAKAAGRNCSAAHPSASVSERSLGAAGVPERRRSSGV